MDNQYYSQYKQDNILDNVIFKNKRGGVFLDIGANDGITLSNTFFLEKSRGWTGLCVEPLPSIFEKLKGNRSCVVENCAASDITRKDILMEISGYSEMLSGLKSSYNKQHLSRINDEMEKYGGERKEIEIDCINVNELLNKHKLKRIDYFSIDTEGSELKILKAINFNDFKIDVITVEANYKKERIKIKLWLFWKGYKYITNLGNDMLFIHKRILKETGSIDQLRNRIIALNTK
jgi:FkbM family methyltransferase